MMASTSLEAYDKEGMATLREKVYTIISECNMLSNRDIAEILGKDNGTISGRTNELAKEGRIYAWCKKKDKMTGKMVQVWEAIGC